MTDLATGLYAHGAIMAALIQRIQTGKGQKISCDLLSTQVCTNSRTASDVDGTLHTDLAGFENIRDIKKVIKYHFNNLKSKIDS